MKLNISKSVKCLHKDCEVYENYGNFKLFKCKKCGIVYNKFFLVKREDVYEDYYKNELGVNFGRFKFGLEYVIKLFRLLRAIRVVTIVGVKKRILDIGCGRGWTLYYLKNFFKYPRTNGTQIAFPAWKFATEYLSLEVYCKDLLDINLGKDKFDVITLWHVLEHVDKPIHYFEEIHKLLSKGGKLLIEVPNMNSWTRKFTGYYWLGLDPEYHLTYYSPESLTTFLQEFGFKIKKMQTFSLEYSAFISTQSIVSRITNTNQLIFNFLQRPRFESKLLVHFLMFILFFPVGFIVNLLLYFTDRGEVIVVVAEKVD